MQQQFFQTANDQQKAVQRFQPYHETVSASSISGVNASDPNFWNHHGHDRESYMNLASYLPEVQERMIQGATYEELKKDPVLGPTVRAYYSPDTPITVEKQADGSLTFGTDGRHRIAAAREFGYDVDAKVEYDYGWEAPNQAAPEATMDAPKMDVFADPSMAEEIDLGAAAGTAPTQPQHEAHSEDLTSQTAVPLNNYYQSSYADRIRQTPSLESNRWSDKRGESVCAPQSDTARQIMEERGISGVQYHDGVPDFSPFAESTVKLGYMTDARHSQGLTAGRDGKDTVYAHFEDGEMVSKTHNADKSSMADLHLKYDKPGNFEQADALTAEQWTADGRDGKEWFAEDVAQYRQDHGLTWHECNDRETMQMIPEAINADFGHLGGVGEVKETERIVEEALRDYDEGQMVEGEDYDRMTPEELEAAAREHGHYDDDGVWVPDESTDAASIDLPPDDHPPVDGSPDDGGDNPPDEGPDGGDELPPDSQPVDGTPDDGGDNSPDEGPDGGDELPPDGQPVDGSPDDGGDSPPDEGPDGRDELPPDGQSPMDDSPDDDGDNPPDVSPDEISEDETPDSSDSESIVDTQESTEQAAQEAAEQEAEERAAEEAAEQEEEEQAAQEAAEQEVEEQTAEEAAEQEAEEQAAEEVAEQEVEEQAAEEAAEQEAEEQAAEEVAEQEAEEQAAEEAAEQGAEEQATQEAAEQEAEEQSAEKAAEQEVEEAAEQEAEEQAAEEAAEQEAEEQAAEEAAEQEAEEQAAEEAAEQEAEEQAAEEAAEQEAEEQAAEEAAEQEAEEAAEHEAEESYDDLADEEPEELLDDAEDYSDLADEPVDESFDDSSYEDFADEAEDSFADEAADYSDMADDADSGSFEDTSFDSSDASFDSGDTGSFDGGGDSIE